MSIAGAARARGIEQVLHYTSNKGLMGSVIAGELLSRKQVEESEEVAYIYEGVWDRSRDADWIDYISMTLTAINRTLFAQSSRKHPDWWWCVMSFAVDLLDEPGVIFTTTNNAYDVCERGSGSAGFDAMFGARVPWGHYGSVAVRGEGHSSAHPTHEAAEVLFPKRIPVDQVQRLYLSDAAYIPLVSAWCEIYGRQPLPVTVDPGCFS